MIGINLVAPKAGAKHELLFNEPASGYYNYERKLHILIVNYDCKTFIIQATGYVMSFAIT